MATIPKPTNGYLTDMLLVATHTVNDGCFNKTVIYVCAHNDEGAMGVIVNMPLNGINLRALLEELDMPHVAHLPDESIYFGGPVETNQGFVVHSDDRTYPGTVTSKSGICLSAGMRLLEDIAKGCGPSKFITALGYAGWSAGQLEEELQSGSWITVPATNALLFATPAEEKWATVAGSLGVDLNRLSSEVGHA